MANGQTPFEKVFPALPDGFEEPFWYASLQSFWLYYRVDSELLRERLPELPEHEGLEVARFDFGDGDLSGLASLDLQRYTGMGPSYLETANEVEFNFYAYPKQRVPDVPLMTWQDYISGVEQTKTIGGYRLHVPCDNAIAVAAGKGLYGEPKYQAVFETSVPSLNGGPGNAWSYSVYQDLGPPTPPPNPHTPVKGPLIYSLAADLGAGAGTPTSPSPLIEYGVVTPTGGSARVVANFWDFFGPFDTYELAGLDPPIQSEITLGTEPDPSGTLEDVRDLVMGNPPIAAQVFTSAPVSAESRGWFPVPEP
jgi:hypothetical protein